MSALRPLTGIHRKIQILVFDGKFDEGGPASDLQDLNCRLDRLAQALFPIV